jgi:hypothetical protein
MPDDLPTPRSTLRSRYARVLVWCKACRRQKEPNLRRPHHAREERVDLRRRSACASD